MYSLSLHDALPIWDGAADQQRVDEVVGVVDAEEHGAVGGDALGVADVHRSEEEPEPEARDRAHGAIEAVHCVAPRVRLEGGAHGMRAKPSISRRAVR